MRINMGGAVALGAIGASVGAALRNVALGVAVGIAAGAALGALAARRNRNQLRSAKRWRKRE